MIEQVVLIDFLCDRATSVEELKEVLLIEYIKRENLHLPLSFYEYNNHGQFITKMYVATVRVSYTSSRVYYIIMFYLVYTFVTCSHFVNMNYIFMNN